MWKKKGLKKRVYADIKKATYLQSGGVVGIVKIYENRICHRKCRGGEGDDVRWTLKRVRKYRLLAKKKRVSRGRRKKNDGDTKPKTKAIKTRQRGGKKCRKPSEEGRVKGSSTLEHERTRSRRKKRRD